MDNRLLNFYINTISFYFRRKRKCSKENILKMGQFTFGSGRVQNSGSVRRSARWKDAHQTTGSAIRGEACTSKLNSLQSAYDTK